MDERARRRQDIDPKTHPELFTKDINGNWFEVYKQEKQKD